MEVIGERGDFSAVEIFLKYSQTAAQKLRRKQKLFFKRHGYQDVVRQLDVEFLAYVIRKYIRAGGC